MNERVVTLKYILSQFFKDDIDEIVDVTGYSKSVIDAWMKG